MDGERRLGVMCMFMQSSKGRDTMEKVCEVLFTWDDEVDVWIATSNDIPGLVLEHSSFDVLVERVRYAAPELLEFNCSYSGSINLKFSISCYERMAV